MDIEDIQFLVWLAITVGGGVTVVMVPGKNLVKGILTLIILAGSAALFVALSAEVSADNFLAGLIISGFVLSLAALCTWVCKEMWRKILQAWRTVKQMDKDDSKKWINNLGKVIKILALDLKKEIGSFALDLGKVIGSFALLYLLLVFLIGALIVALIVHAPLFFLPWLLHTIADALREGDKDQLRTMSLFEMLV